MPIIRLQEWDADVIHDQLMIYRGNGTLTHVSREQGKNRWEVHYWYENQKRILMLRNTDMAQGFLWGLHGGMASVLNQLPD
jgi:hypothetical protein